MPFTFLLPVPGTFNCNFENNFCGWTQAHDDQFDWTRQSRPTTTTNTGPSRDHTTGRELYTHITVVVVVTVAVASNLLSPQNSFLVLKPETAMHIFHTTLTCDKTQTKVETSLEWQKHFLSVPRYDKSAPLSRPFFCLFVIHGPSHYSRAARKSTCHGNEVLQQDITHLILRPFYQHRSLCQDPAGNCTTQRPPDHHKKMQTMDISPVHWVWPKPSCKAQWKGGEDKADRRRDGKTTSGNGQAWSLPSPRGQLKTEKNGGNWLWSHLWQCEVICGAPTTLVVKAWMKVHSHGHCRHCLSAVTGVCVVHSRLQRHWCLDLCGVAGVTLLCTKAP